MAFQLDNTVAQDKNKEAKTEKESFLKKEITLFQNPFSNKVKEQFYTELSVLLNAGVNLKMSLELIEDSQKKKLRKSIIKKLSESIISGQSLSEAFQESEQFTDYEFHSIKIGEETGTLAQVTTQLGEFYARKNEQKKQLVSALTYPVIILSTAVLVVIFMLNYVVPMFEDMFRQQQVDLPQITKYIISASNFLEQKGWMILLLCFSPFVTRLFLKNNKRYKQYKHIIMSKLPFIGGFIKTVYLSQFTQAVALLTVSKVPIVNSIQLVKQMIDFYPLQKALNSTEKDILSGKSLSVGLSKHKLFDAKMIALIKVAEETNQTEYIFEKLNLQYNTQVQQQSKMLSTLMEPFIILFVGVIVGVILVAMYLPMFKLSSVIG
ncbi:type II secretion system F family protein [Pontimicrobium sp. SW4]|uniref:General secretion pathway protein F n=1 Tax=Pontimicrobium sp. SW4 TaxID=3153519 RepID=A0AAU7BQG6_9FLAO